jgi:hypothetical protein
VPLRSYRRIIALRARDAMIPPEKTTDTHLSGQKPALYGPA